MAEMDNSILGYFPEAELVIALVYPLGTERIGLDVALTDYLGQFGYETNSIHLTKVFPGLFKRLDKKWAPPTRLADLAHYKIEAGNVPEMVSVTVQMLGK